VASTRGGVYSTNPAADHQEGYLKLVFGFFGITDVRFVRAEGLAMGDEARARALAEAEAHIRAVTADPLGAALPGQARKAQAEAALAG
jgi:FMN-dependent NADH-azoreductase